MARSRAPQQGMAVVVLPRRGFRARRYVVRGERFQPPERKGLGGLVDRILDRFRSGVGSFLAGFAPITEHERHQCDLLHGHLLPPGATHCLRCKKPAGRILCNRHGHLRFSRCPRCGG